MRSGPRPSRSPSCALTYGPPMGLPPTGVRLNRHRYKGAMHKKKSPSRLPKDFPGGREGCCEPCDYTRPRRITTNIMASMPETSSTSELGSGVATVSTKNSCTEPEPFKFTSETMRKLFGLILP